MLCVSRNVYLYQTIVCWIVLFNSRRAFVVAFSPLSPSIESYGGRTYQTLQNNNSNMNNNSEDDNSARLNAPASFSHELIFVRDIPHLTPEDACKRCVCAFRDVNLGLPSFLPCPEVENRGDENTGVGLVIRRDPIQIREGIVDCQVDTATGIWTLFYKVLNPSYTTFPVEDHLGTITLSPKSDISNSSTLGCQLIWKVQWTPLSPSLLINLLAKPVINLVVNSACNYIAKQETVQ